MTPALFSIEIPKGHEAILDVLMSQGYGSNNRESFLRETGESAILGQISFSGPGTFSDVVVQLFSTDNYVVKEATLDNLGHYQFACLPAATYIVKTKNIGVDNFTDRWYGGAYRITEASIIETDGVNPIVGVDIELEIGGNISGNLMAPGTASVLLSLYDGISEELISTITINPGETFLFSKLYSSTYKLRATSPVYQNGWYEDATNFESATGINVSQGQETSNINMTLLETNPAPMISGTVFYESSTPAVNNLVAAYQKEGWPFHMNGTWMGVGFVDSSGEYSISNLDDGEYLVIAGFSISGYRSEIFDDVGYAYEATGIIIQDQQSISNINFSLESTGAEISGTVSFNQGTGSVYCTGITPFDPDNIFEWWINGAVRGSAALIGDDGIYSIQSLWPGEYLAYTRDPESAGDIYFPGTYSQLSADTISILSSDTHVENIDFDIVVDIPVPTGTVTGRIEFSNHPDSDETVILIFYDADNEASVLASASIQTGEYSVSVPEGEYKLIAWYSGLLSYPSFFWYENAEDFENGTRLHVNSEEILPNVDIIFEQCRLYDQLLIDSNSGIPSRYLLSQNFPNPFNPITAIKYELPELSDVSLYIYDIRGRQIKSWSIEEQPAGGYLLFWNGDNEAGKQVATGVYFAHIQSGDFSQVIKMVYLK